MSTIAWHLSFGISCASPKCYAQENVLSLSALLFNLQVLCPPNEMKPHWTNLFHRALPTSVSFRFIVSLGERLNRVWCQQDCENRDCSAILFTETNMGMVSKVGQWMDQRKEVKALKCNVLTMQCWKITESKQCNVLTRLLRNLVHRNQHGLVSWWAAF